MAPAEKRRLACASSNRSRLPTVRGVLTRLQLGRGQILVYLAAIALGAALGWNLPVAAPVLEKLLWPVLAALLYVTFAQRCRCWKCAA